MTDAILDRARELLRIAMRHEGLQPSAVDGNDIVLVCTALLARTERIHKLETALRGEAIKRAPNLSGRVAPSEVCNLCRGRWAPNAPERHAADCLLAALQEGGK